MSRLTVRLPETLHRQLSDMAKGEGISLNQYIVYALTRQITLAYTVRSVPQAEVTQQRASFAALLQGLGQATFSQVEQVLAERDEVPTEAELTPEVVSRVREQFEGYSFRNSAGEET